MASKPSRNDKKPPANRPGKGAAKSAAAKLAAPKSAAPKSAATKPDGAAFTAAEAEALFSQFRAANPQPRGELNSVNPYTLLVAVVLSAQATDAGVNKATRPLFATVDTPQKMVALGEARLAEAIKTIGLYRNKAKNVIALSQRLIAEHAGAVPNDQTALEALPGVGRKTANVVRNIAFGEPTIAVDTHVFRVANRLGLAPGKTPLAVEEALERVVPAAFRLHAHHWLILHGRYVCKAVKPDCAACIVRALCRFPDKTGDAAPRPRARA